MIQSFHNSMHCCKLDEQITIQKVDEHQRHIQKINLRVLVTQISDITTNYYSRDG
jgi:hypothetical protein